jgi:hypothetical protein
VGNDFDTPRTSIIAAALPLAYRRPHSTVGVALALVLPALLIVSSFADNLYLSNKNIFSRHNSSSVMIIYLSD